MRPSIAAALSTLGEDHPASLVLLRPEDSARFAIAPDGSPRSDRVSVRPDGSLLLFVVTGAPPYLSSITIVGAVEPAAWTWADPKKRQPAPLARVNLDARDIHCLTQGGEIHRGATVGTTTDGRAALQAAARPLTFAGIDLRPSMQAFPRFWAAALSIKPADAARTPKDGDTLGSLTVSDLNGLPVGARFVREPYMPIVKTAHNGWVTPDGTHRSAVEVLSTRITGALDRTLVLPVTKRTPKDGDRLDSFTAAELDGLPVGSRFELPDFPVLERTADGWRKDSHATYPHTIVIGSQELGHRTLVLPKPAEAPKPAAPPKVGDRWGNLTPDQRAALPVGTVIKEEGRITVATWTRLPSGWSRVVVDTSATALYIANTCEPTKTSVIASLPVSK